MFSDRPVRAADATCCKFKHMYARNECCCCCCFRVKDAPMEDKFYEGFCKTILWPLFHSSMPTTEDTIASHDADSIEEQREEGQLWMAYKASFLLNLAPDCPRAVV